ncbi:Fasciclin domain-containing protein [Panaeolus papilionaceus]|nr:Fasciclin domain-containing protein [Panaeolus papilionaceus]
MVSASYLAYQWPLASFANRIITNQHENRPTTIYETISNDPRFSKLTKVINVFDDVVACLNDSSNRVTLFAPPDSVLRRPEPKATSQGDYDIFTPFQSLESALSSEHVANLVYLSHMLDLEPSKFPDEYCDHAGDKEECRKKLRFILRALLGYHLIPTGAYTVHDLGLNLTFPTNLTIDGAFDSRPERIRVQQSIIPPRTSINFYSRIKEQDLQASNGIIHVVDHPLIPPPSVFQLLYFMPHYFSTLTSALQHTDLRDKLDLRYNHEEGLHGSSLVTIFAPTNRAFDKLPRKLRMFLFSPFGEKALKKVLEYHVIPRTVVESDYIHHQKTACALQRQDFETSSGFAEYAKDFVLGKHHRELISFINVTLPTLLPNHKVNTLIYKTKVKFPFPGHKNAYRVDTKVTVNNHHVRIPDIVASNGAIQVIDRLLDPHLESHHPDCPHHGEGVEEPWKNWESWLMSWAET